ncbi:hypothetical protein FRACYDRAFT_268540 [Fragilariopsis cylindrus CCMP1102]|uniref:Uncharacterized protein n=1 Tax=Fragilariopsis cylindrus CCMP1102 TaxID=635003 RepID=A0A1E7FLT0_9STRA|nr:hypothetical protein FRACYDRAFT_268540 [Fragilariopsis cylindrus CCMP1102]|eukprot:OEU19025.1 hypothetical protein FRACYDRAFT_268540 [Fragilariopsis cylindrus CCMP1102]
MSVSYGCETLGMALSILLTLIFGGLLFLIAGSNINVKNNDDTSSYIISSNGSNIDNDGRNDCDTVAATKTNESTNNDDDDDDDDVATGVPKTPWSPAWTTPIRARVVKKEVRGDRDQNSSNCHNNDGGDGTGSLRDTTNIDNTHDVGASSSWSTCSYPTTLKSRSKNERAQARTNYENDY